MDLFLETYNRQDDEGRSYVDSFGELPDLQRDAGVPNAEALTLDKIKTNLDRVIAIVKSWRAKFRKYTSKRF